MEGGSSRASNTANTTNNTSASVATVRVNNTSDPAWEWGYVKVPIEKGFIWCKLCDKRMSGGVTRLKHHLVNKAGQKAVQMPPPRLRKEFGRFCMIKIKRRRKV